MGSLGGRMAEPVIVDCPGACTVTVVHELSLPPLQLDASEGAAIAGSILAVWAVGWGFRTLIRHLKSSDGYSTSNEEN